WTVAVDRCPDLNSFTSTDLFYSSEYFLGGGAGKAPTRVTTVTGGVYRTPEAAAVAAGWISLGATDDLKLIGSPMTESWYVSAR
ncbi:hypothetical protein ACXWOS_10385, partial [Streptococcus pyogenes]